MTDASVPNNFPNNLSREYCLVWVSAASETEAAAIAKTLVQAKLAACVSIMPITSIYTWQSELHQDAEWQLLIKTKWVCFDELAQRVQELHSYDVPEMIAVPIQAGSRAYLDWIDTSIDQ